MKAKFLTLAAASMLMAGPALANEKSAEDVQKKVDEWFAKADTDGNGTISKAEFTADAGAKFDEADADKNGELTKDEKIAHKKAEWEKHKD